MVIATGVDHQRAPFDLLYFLYTWSQNRVGRSTFIVNVQCRKVTQMPLAVGPMVLALVTRIEVPARALAATFSPSVVPASHSPFHVRETHECGRQGFQIGRENQAVFGFCDGHLPH